jgi:arylsulfatase A-like enzyme
VKRFDHFTRKSTKGEIMQKTIPSLLLAALAGVIAATAKAETSKPRPPNVVIIMADDLGYGDISAYGEGKIKTPAIDALARQGVKMTDAYSAASTCTPSRYALMTGEYPSRQKGASILSGDAAMLISPARLTLPRIFKNAGYATGLVGKWHLGLGDGNVDFNQQVKPGPNELGFDYTYNMAATGDRVPTVYLENGRVVNLNPADPITVSYDHKIGNLPTARAHPEMQRINLNAYMDGTIINGIGRIGFMSGGTAAIWQDQSMGDTFNAKALDFIRTNKKEPFFLFYAAHEPHVPRDPNPRFVGKSGIDQRGDAVLQFDDQVDRLMATLRELGLERNTLVLLTSDNGAFLNPNLSPKHRPNGSLHGGKFSNFEGGVRMPLIVSWPGHIKPNSECNQIVSLADMPALAASLTRQTLKATDAIDSIDPLPALLRCAKTRDNVLLGEPNKATPGLAPSIRSGDWKLLTSPDGSQAHVADAAEYPRLYNLATDKSESVNVAKDHPDIVARLRAILGRSATAGFTRPGAQAVSER